MNASSSPNSAATTPSICEATSASKPSRTGGTSLRTSQTSRRARPRVAATTAIRSSHIGMWLISPRSMRRPYGTGRRPAAALSARGSVLPVVSLQQPFLLVLPREAQEDERRTKENGDDSGGVGQVGAVEEGLLRRRRDLVRVLRILLGDRLGTGERLLQLRLDAVRDLRLLRRGCAGDRGGDGRRIAGGQQRAEDRLHDRAAQVALEIGGARGHPGPGHGDGTGERVRGRCAGE